MTKTDAPMPLEAVSRLDITIPVELLREFKAEPRIIIRYPWVIGIPVPELIRKEFLDRVTNAGYEVMLVPKQAVR
jgi:hypothetical protein